jgi:hypothetical protein
MQVAPFAVLGMLIVPEHLPTIFCELKKVHAWLASLPGVLY